MSGLLLSRVTTLLLVGINFYPHVIRLINAAVIFNGMAVYYR